jgi:N utilization substance protein B
MAISQQKFREIVFHLLYSHDFAQNTVEDMIPFLMAQHSVPKKTLYTAEAKSSLVIDKLSEIDAMITEISTSYQFERISRIEKNILRLGIFELCFSEDIPPKVAISEGIRLARKFATPEGASFVNAVLDAIYRRKETQ